MHVTSMSGMEVDVSSTPCEFALVTGEDKKNITCEGKPYHTRMKLSCPFHSLAYEIECNKTAKQVKKLVHPILKRGHSNFHEASHNVLIRFSSSLERLHYQLSTNLGLLDLHAQQARY